MESVTKEDLRRYLGMKATIAGLRAEIRQIRESSPKPHEVLGGRMSAKAPSDPTLRKAMQVIETENRLERKLAEYETMTDRIERWTEDLSATNPEVAEIIRLHYLHGISWATTCETMYGYRDEDRCRKTIRRWFRRQGEEQTNDHEETDA